MHPYPTFRLRTVFALGLTIGIGLTNVQAQTLPMLTTSDGQLNNAWRFVGFPSQHKPLPPTLFEAGMVGGTPAVKVSTDSSYGTLVRDGLTLNGGRLQWRWRLDQPLSGGQHPPDLRSKDGDDAALKVCVMFEHALAQVPFLERTTLRLARAISGEALPAATVCYVWDTAGSTPAEGANPYTRRVRYIVLQGQATPQGQWFNESRDIAQDFIHLFHDELPQGKATPAAQAPRVHTVLIGADSDNTGSRSQGWVASLSWHP